MSNHCFVYLKLTLYCLSTEIENKLLKKGMRTKQRVVGIGQWSSKFQRGAVCVVTGSERELGSGWLRRGGDEVTGAEIKEAEAKM